MCNTIDWENFVIKINFVWTNVYEIKTHERFWQIVLMQTAFWMNWCGKDTLVDVHQV